MLDLYAPNTEGRRPRLDERFHLQQPKGWCDGWGVDWLYRSVKWHNVYLEDGSPGWFNSYILLWVIRWYVGTVKHDGSRTFAYENGQLGDYEGGYVMTTTPKEMLSVRVRWKKPNREVWTNQGGI